MSNQDVHVQLREAFQKFTEEVETLKRTHEEKIRSILRQIDERKVRDVRRRLGIGE